MAKQTANGWQDNIAIVIPARMASTRLPGKPLLDIKGTPMIVRVWQQAVQADIATVLVATADTAIAHAIEGAGGTAVMTSPGLPSGSDRIAAALKKVDRQGKFTTIVNLQGDMPTITPQAIIKCLTPLKDAAVDIATLVAKSNDPEELADPNTVKAVVEFEDDQTIARAHDFCRMLPDGHTGPHYHHIGIYAYRRTALETFIKLPVSIREHRLSLEQLRALDAGMRIDVCLVDTVPIGVDTPADLKFVRALF